MPLRMRPLQLLIGVYGAPIMMKRLMAMDNVVVMLTRETADAARVNADPATLVAYPPPPPAKSESAWEDDDPWAEEDQAALAAAPAAEGDGGGVDAADGGKPPPPPPPVVSWGCVDEAIEMSALPPHLEHVTLQEARRQCLSYDTLTHLDDPRGIDSDELIEILLRAWRTLRRQQAEMLRERFDAADADADGILTLPEFWSCLQSLLKAMVREGGAAEAAAEPWLERGQAELLYNQICVESEFLGVPGAAHTLVIAREAFVNVMMRRRLVDANFSAYLQAHPDERLVLK